MPILFFTELGKIMPTECLKSHRSNNDPKITKVVYSKKNKAEVVFQTYDRAIVFKKEKKNNNKNPQHGNSIKPDTQKNETY